MFQQESDVEQHLYELTWFGSHFKARIYEARTFEWSLFGSSRTYRPRRRVEFFELAEPVETFEFSVKDEQGHQIGSAALAASSSRAFKSNKLYHSRLGLLSPTLASDQWLPRKQARHVGFVIEFDDTKLVYGVDGEVGPYDTWQAAVVALQTATRVCVQSLSFLDFMNTLESANRARAAQALAARQEALSVRARVYYRDIELGCVPQSENEVVVLMAKLEALGGIPMPLFRLLEYTPRQGIDALGDFQLTAQAAPERLAPIEVEYHFESFLRHGHAVEQVRLIVCWGFRNESTKSNPTLNRQEEWFYTYSRDQYSVAVFLLSKLPGLTERGSGK